MCLPVKCFYHDIRIQEHSVLWQLLLSKMLVCRILKFPPLKTKIISPFLLSLCVSTEKCTGTERVCNRAIMLDYVTHCQLRFCAFSIADVEDSRVLRSKGVTAIPSWSVCVYRGMDCTLIGWLRQTLASTRATSTTSCSLLSPTSSHWWSKVKWSAVVMIMTMRDIWFDHYPRRRRSCRRRG